MIKFSIFGILTQLHIDAEKDTVSLVVRDADGTNVTVSLPKDRAMHLGKQMIKRQALTVKVSGELAPKTNEYQYQFSGPVPTSVYTTQASSGPWQFQANRVETIYLHEESADC